MKHKQFIFKLLSATMLISALAFIVHAQQLYVNRTGVYFIAGAPYCDTRTVSLDANGYNANDRSSITVANNARIEFERPANTYPANCLMLCASIRCTNPQLLENGIKEDAPAFGVDTLKFEVFKYEAGSNALDPASTPPVNTIFLHDINTCPGTSGSDVINRSIGTYCSAWDASHNLDGEFGKRNGTYGFRATVITNQTSPEIGNINIEQTSAYPGESQKEITVDVVNIHAIRSTPTVVGQVSGVPAQPYQIKYRLSKDSIVSMKIIDPMVTNTANFVTRQLLDQIPKIGESQPDGTLANVDIWDGRDTQGRLIAAGNYRVLIDAYAIDGYNYPGGPVSPYPSPATADHAYQKERQLSIDPIKITDYRITGLGSRTTDVASIGYMLTEAAEVFVFIYPEGTTFVDTAQSFPTAINDNIPYPATNPVGDPVKPLRTIITQQQGRTPVYTYWDGRDDEGYPLRDGTYVAAILARTPGAVINQAKTGYEDGYVYTSYFDIKPIAVARGKVSTSNIQPVTTIIGSTPTVSGLDPFSFKYSLSRGAEIDLTVFRVNSENGVIISTTLVRNLLQRESRMGEFAHEEKWNGTDNYGRTVTAGTYMVELLAYDTLFPDDEPFRLTTSVSYDPLRITDVKSLPLLGGTSEYATISYLLSRSMQTTINIYRPGTVIPTDTWPPTVSATPVKTMSGPRPGRYPISEFWDAIYNDQMLADGEYVYSIVAQSESDFSDYSQCTTNICNPIIVSKPYVDADRIVGNVTVFRGPVYVSNLTVTPTYAEMIINSSGTVKLPPYNIKFNVTATSSITIQAISDTVCNQPPYTGNVCRTIVSGGVYTPNSEISGYTELWDGLDDFSQMLPKDTYMIRIIANNYPNPELQNPTTSQIPVEHDPYQVYDTGIRDITSDTPTGAIAYQLSVPMTVAIQIFKPGTVITASGNPNPPIASGSLARVLYGVRPNMMPVEEIWDGRDNRGLQLPDGVYMYRIVTSTYTNVINQDTGEFVNNNPYYVADDTTYVFGWGNITLSNNASRDVCEDFNTRTVFYPNPLRQNKGTFEISSIPVNGNYNLRLYNIAGDLVYSRDWGYKNSGNTLKEEWTRVNNHGKQVARGIYYAVLELKEVGGGKQICQTTRKILVP